jgi:periplasmic protein TonB
MGYKALLFCPDEKLANVVTQVFSELDFTVEAVHEPFAAVKRLMAQRYDAIAVDSENEQNASLLFKSARNSSSNQGSLAIALVDGQMGVAKAYRIGANLVLTKPINVEQAKGTLRVARGLLRKSSDAATGAGTVSSMPAKTAATSADSSFQPANRGANAMAPPPNHAEAPEFEAPHPAMIPDPVSADFPEESAGEVRAEFEATTASAKVEDQPAAVPAPAAQPPVTITPVLAIERRRPLAPGAIQNVVKKDAAISAAASVPSQKPQNTSSSFTSVPGSAAAPAPAKEITAPPVKKNRIVEADPTTPLHDTTHDTAPIPVPTFSSGSVSDAPSFATFGEGDTGEPGGSKQTKTLIAAAAVLTLAALGYLGYGYLVKPSPTSPPVNAPQASSQPKPALRPASTPVDTASKTAMVAPSPSNPSSSTGSENSPVIRIAANVAPNSAPNSAPNVALNSATSSDPKARKPDSAPNFVKPTRPGAQPQDQGDEPSPPSPLVVASANDSNLSGLMSVSPSLAKPTLATPKISQGVSQGLLIKRVEPKYPQAALAVHAQGAVLIEATINKEGNVTNPKVLSGDPVLARSAVEAVRQWRYKPYTLDGAPVEIQTQITINFKAN